MARSAARRSEPEGSVDDSCFMVRHHPRAEKELKEITDMRDRLALFTVVDKLRRIGRKVTAPHSKPIQGVSGLHELRPQGGRSVWRLLYAAVGTEFVILAVTRTTQVRKHEFQAGIERARRRGKDYGLDL